MLATVRRHFCIPGSEVTLAVTPWFGSVQERLKYNLAQKLDWNRWGRSRIGMAVTSRSFRRTMGLFDDSDVNALIDISGFAFGDQHPVRRTAEFAERVSAAKRLGSKVILLPQAFGPFERPEIRSSFNKIMDLADLIYARDEVSFDHLVQTFGLRENIHVAPDITIAFRAERPALTLSSEVLLVPNMRMVDKSDVELAERYIPLLQSCIRTAQAASHVPKLLLHDAIEDRKLVPRIQCGLDQTVEVVEEPDPFALKQIISRATLLIGSRFHALVSALSSGVPVLATGWSHKYRMLLEEFGCPDSILDLAVADNVLQAKLESHLEPGFQKTTRERLTATASALVTRTEEMWQRVDRVVGWEAPCV